MIPVSRKVRRGSHRNLLPTLLNGEVVAPDGDPRSTTIKTRLCNVDSLSVGDFNKIDVYKRYVKYGQADVVTANLNVSAGDLNALKIKLASLSAQDFTFDIDVGNNNVVDVIVYDEDGVFLGNNNVVIGELDTKDTGVSIGDDNILVNFKPEIKAGTRVTAHRKSSFLHYETKISEYAGAGQDYIEVEDTTKVMAGTEIIFGSVASAFVRKNVVSVVGNRVYFDEPLLPKEATFPDADVFNEYYDVIPEYRSTILYDVEAYTKRIYLADTANLHLRDVTIGDSFTTKVMLTRDSDNLAIIKDLTTDEMPAGTEVYSPGVDKFAQWDISISIDETNSKKAVFGGVNNAYIGRSTVVGDTTLAIVGFGDGYIEFDEVIPDGTTSLSFDEISREAARPRFDTFVSEDVGGNSVSIPVDDPSGIHPGQLITISGRSAVLTVDSVVDNTVYLSSPVMQDRIDGKFFVGSYELPVNRDSIIALLDVASSNLHEFIFGSNQ